MTAFVIIVSLTNCSDQQKINNRLNINTESQKYFNYIQIQTGQTKRYNHSDEISQQSNDVAFYGQDADYLKGAKMSFEDNGDGTVTDLNTGLIWQKTPSSMSFSWDQAVDYTEQLNLANFDDWRMPSTKELFSISNFNTGWPYLNLNYFDLANDRVSKDEQYWTSNYYVGATQQGGTDAAFGVNSGTGHIKAYPAKAGGHFGNYVRAVRGKTYGNNNYMDNEDGTITDIASGLMWTKNDNGTGINWVDALAYARNSKVAGFTDWRLPNVKELQGIVDYTRSPTAHKIDDVGPAIDELFVCTEITNEAGEDDYGFYWTSTSAYFNPDKPNYSYAWYVAFGTAPNPDGIDVHGAGAVRFDTKHKGGPSTDDGERIYNYVRLVRDFNLTNN